MKYDDLYWVGRTGEKCSKTCVWKAEINAGYVSSRMYIDITLLEVTVTQSFAKNAPSIPSNVPEVERRAML
jgi:hypothetical protein